MAQVGFIGLGIMGKPMARNLINAGHSLVVHDHKQAPMQELAAEGAQMAQSCRDASQGCEVIITMLPRLRQLRRRHSRTPRRPRRRTRRVHHHRHEFHQPAGESENRRRGRQAQRRDAGRSRQWRRTGRNRWHARHHGGRQRRNLPEATKNCSTSWDAAWYVSAKSAQAMSSSSPTR